MKFKAEMGHWSSVVGNSVHLIGEDGRFLGQIAIMCQDDRLRETDVQIALCEKICAALNADLCASGQQVRVLDVDDLAQIIRVVDGNNTLGAGELAEAILEAMPVPRIVGALTPAPQPEGHPDDLAVDRFAAAMKAKLAKKRAEGRGGWDRKDECSAEDLSYMIVQHLWKGDPLDVGNLAMMLHQRGERIVLDGEAKNIVPQPAQEAVPVWKSVERKFYRSEWPLAKLLEARNGGLVTDEGEAWVYRYTHKDGVGGEYDMLVRRELVSHPTQPSETVAELLEEARSGLCAYSGGPNGACSETVKRIDAALRDLKGVEANG
jgi:hypothetical protein